eukprot:TRINITY_DN1661_c0_g1_i1.p1 TRINITY_DN1661_c0_g1~~TRINITY_DN1661_c0_g1_i1.p1  ORF type:complete len:393 (-),score=74.98 TRINITY_DN1661_c0_g1_i1:132-1274(-)
MTSQLPPNAPEYSQLPTSEGNPSPSEQEVMTQSALQAYPSAQPVQAYPPQGYHPEGLSPQSFPPQEYPQGFIAQGYQPQLYPPQGYPSGQPVQAFPPQGYPTPVPGYPTPNYSFQAYPEGQPLQTFTSSSEVQHVQLQNFSTELLAEENPQSDHDPRSLVDRWTTSDYEIRWEVIKRWYCEAWEIFKSEWVAFVALTLFAILPRFIPHFGWVLTLLIEISFKVYGLHVIRSRVTKGERLYSPKTFYSGLYYCIPVFVLIFIWAILIGIGFLCLIVPGIFLSVCSLFSEPLLLEYYDEYISFEDTFRMSVKVISKHFWWILFFEFLTFLLALSGLLLLGVGALVTIPVARLSVLVAFKDIYGLNPHRRPEGTFYFLCGKTH